MRGVNPAGCLVGDSWPHRHRMTEMPIGIVQKKDIVK